MPMTPTKSTHSDKLERWLGKESVERVSSQFKDFYWPVKLNGIPGDVYVMPGGDFGGEIKAGSYSNKHDSAANALRRILQKAERKPKQDAALRMLMDMIRQGDRRMLSVGAFASVDAVVAAFTGGKGQQILFSKTGVAANAIGNSNDLFFGAGNPAKGAAAAAAPGGTVPTAASVGALPFKNLGVANSGHYLNWVLTSSVVANTLLLYDRIFATAKIMNSTAAETVSGVPTRYQNGTAGAADYIGGNFVFPSNPTTVLAATAHSWTGTYTNQASTAAQAFTTGTGVSACVVGGVDLAVGNWFIGLAAGDNGIKALTQMTASVLVATGTIDFVMGHPIATNVCPIANAGILDDGLYTAINLSAVLDNACLSFMEFTKPAVTATNYSGLVRFVSE
jgi:hypothetical protein